MISRNVLIVAATVAASLTLVLGTVFAGTIAAQYGGNGNSGNGNSGNGNSAGGNMTGQSNSGNGNMNNGGMNSGSSGDQSTPAYLFKLNKKYMDYNGGIFKVKAGVGNEVAPLTQFFPRIAQINVGESVVWYNPTRVGEPHTVSFVMANNEFAPLFAPYGVANSTQFMTLPPGSNSEPQIVPGTNGTNTIVALNARGYDPFVIGSNGTVSMKAPNLNYTMQGDEKFVSSGFLLPQGLGQEFPGSSSTFAVKFIKAGEYDYVCLVHPWMTGKVIVR